MNDGFILHERLAADSVLVRDLALCQLRLQNVKAVPWLVLVPRRAEVRELHHLSKADRGLLMEEVVWASQALEALYQPDKINVGALGNIVPQLHIHVIARFKGDAAWPAPVWGRVDPEPYDERGLSIVVTKVDEAIAKANISLA